MGPEEFYRKLGLCFGDLFRFFSIKKKKKKKKRMINKENQMIGINRFKEESPMFDKRHFFLAC